MSDPRVLLVLTIYATFNTQNQICHDLAVYTVGTSNFDALDVWHKILEGL